MNVSELFGSKFGGYFGTFEYIWFILAFFDILYNFSGVKNLGRSNFWVGQNYRGSKF